MCYDALSAEPRSSRQLSWECDREGDRAGDAKEMVGTMRGGKEKEKAQTWITRSKRKKL